MLSFFPGILYECVEFSINMKEWWKEEDENREKKLGVGGSLLYTMDMQLLKLYKKY